MALRVRRDRIAPGLAIGSAILTMLLAASVASAQCDVESLEISLTPTLPLAPGSAQRAAWRISGATSVQLTVIAVSEDETRTDVTTGATYAPLGSHIALTSSGRLQFASSPSRSIEGVEVEYCGVRRLLGFVLSPE